MKLWTCFLLMSLCLLSVNCDKFKKKEIPSLNRESVQSGDEAAWDSYYNAIPELKPLDKTKTYKIRVLRVQDERLPDFSSSEYEELYREIEIGVKKYLGYTIQLEEVGQKEIISFFASFSEAFMQPPFRFWVGNHYLRLNLDKDRERLRETISNEIKHRSPKIVTNYIPVEKRSEINTHKKTVDYFYAEFLRKHNEIGSTNTLKPTPLRDGQYEITQQYMYWSALLMNIREADLVITNSIIAGADEGMPVYVINRGGVTSAITENSIYNEFQGTIAMTLFPFISHEDFFQEARGSIPEHRVVYIIAMMAVHEFGHLLGRYREYYDAPGSPHNAPRGLAYYEWYRKIYKNQPPETPVKLETLNKY
ncbi:MAG: hypothetical protein ABUK01_09880 [Leptospirales bacterium]